MQGVGKYFGVEGQISNRQTCCELDSKFYITIKEITIVSSEKFVDWPISSWRSICKNTRKKQGDF